jgi:FkbM family methyltransferase
MTINIRRIARTPFFTIAEWEHPEEGKRDWDQEYEAYVNVFHFGDYISYGDLVVDVGAHTGDTSVILATLSGNVIAIEPNPEVFPILELNTLLNPDFWIHPVQCAVAEDDREVDLYDHSSMHCNMSMVKRGKPVHRVQAHNLVDIVTNVGCELSSIRFIKIDCEGYDINIFKSIPQILELAKPIVFMEWHEDVNPVHFISTIKSMNYIPYNPITLEKSTSDERTRDVLCFHYSQTP